MFDECGLDVDGASLAMYLHPRVRGADTTLEYRKKSEEKHVWSEQITSQSPRGQRDRSLEQDHRLRCLPAVGGLPVLSLHSDALPVVADRRVPKAPEASMRMRCRNEQET
jgi:hypothetical protein